MEDRIAAVRDHWYHPEVALDPNELAASQETHFLLREAALSRGGGDVRQGFSWDQVRAAMGEINTNSPAETSGRNV